MKRLCLLGLIPLLGGQEFALWLPLEHCYDYNRKSPPQSSSNSHHHWSKRASLAQFYVQKSQSTSSPPRESRDAPVTPVCLLLLTIQSVEFQKRAHKNQHRGNLSGFVKQTNKKVNSSLLIVVKMTNIRQWHLLTCIPGSVGFLFLSVTSDLPFWLSSPAYYLMHSLAFLHGQCQLASDCRYARKDSHSALLANATKHYVSGHLFWVQPFL